MSRSRVRSFEACRSSLYLPRTNETGIQTLTIHDADDLHMEILEGSDWGRLLCCAASHAISRPQQIPDRALVSHLISQFADNLVTFDPMSILEQ